MKHIDFVNIGYGVLIMCMGYGLVLGHITDAERLKDCDRRGGAFVKTSDSWGAEKYCRVAPGAAK